jgi:hypothetical protein
VTMPPPDEDETPEEEETPDEAEVPDEDVPDDEVPADEPPAPPAPDGPLTDRCGSDGVKCANSAPVTAATPAEIRPMRQVIFLTRRRPSSRAKTALEYWVRFMLNIRRRISVTKRSYF